MAIRRHDLPHAGLYRHKNGEKQPCLEHVSCRARGVAQGWGERNVQLEPAGSAKRGLEAGPTDLMLFSGCSCHSLSVFSLSNRYHSMEAAICCGESDL